MLTITNLNAVIQDTDLLEDINLIVNVGEIHAIMGPLHSGKTSLVHAIMGVPSILYTDGTINFKKKVINDKSIYARSIMGLFTSFQDPPLIDAVTNFELIQTILKAHKDKRTLSEIEKIYKELCTDLGLSSNHGHKLVSSESLTVTERKKNELLHMWLLDPDFIVLDEIDEGVEADEIECIANNINSFLLKKGKAAIIVTHNKKLLDILNPDFVHVMVDGSICESGSTDLYKRIVEDGYTQFS